MLQSACHQLLTRFYIKNSHMAQKRQKNDNTPEVTSKYYLSNSRLLPEVIASKEAGKISDELAKMLLMLTRKYANRSCFSRYSYREDMISEALAGLCQNALKFNPEKSNNPFAFYTTCINNSFLHILGVEKKHRKIRDRLLVDIGESPSFSFTEEYNNLQSSEYGNDINMLKSEIEEAKARISQDELLAIAAEAKSIESIAAISITGNQEEIEQIEAIIDPMDLVEFEDE